MGVFGHILPIAVAVALSSVPIMVTILILLSPGRARSAPLFLVGWIIGIVVVVSVCTLAAQLVPTSRSPRKPDTAVGVIEIVIGLALVVLALFAWRRARRRTTAAATPKWMSSGRTLRPWESFGAALILNVRPKALLLAIAAGLTIRADSQSTTEAVVAIGFYSLIAASTVVVPIVATMVAPSRMEPRLTSMRAWLIDHGDAMRSVILILIGVVIIGTGIGRLA